MEVYYLHNSGFALILEKSLLIFDYYKTVTNSPNKNFSGGVVSEEDLTGKENIYVFSSHSHPDHFNPVIYKWMQIRPDIQYFLDDGIEKQAQSNEIYHAVYMKKGDVFEGDNIKVKAFGSTDIGISFYVETEGLKIFHAGDLNDWHWRDSTSQAYAEKAHIDFLREMAVIEKGTDALDLAFFPVDPRIGEGYDEGAAYFIQSLKPAVFIPMHCMGPLEILQDFQHKFIQSDTQVRTYRERGEKIVIGRTDEEPVGP